MKRISKALFVAAASVAMTGVAFAEEAEAPQPPPDGSEQPPPEGTPPPTAEPAAAGALSTANWPTSYMMRTLNAAKGMLEVGGFLNIGLVKDADTVIGLDLVGRYGVNEKIEALFAYQGSAFLAGTGSSGIILSPDSEFKGTIAVGGGYAAIANGAGGKLDVEPKAAIQYDLLGETAVLAAGADVRYKINDKLWVGTPQNRPGLVITLKGQDIAIPMVGTVTVSPIFFDLPVGVGFQVNDKLHVQANTTLLHLALNDDAGDTGFFGADFIPLDLEALFAVSNKLDVRAKLNFGELKDSAGDFIGISLGASFRL